MPKKSAAVEIDDDFNLTRKPKTKRPTMSLDDDDEPFFASPTVPRLVIRASTASPPRATS